MGVKKKVFFSFLGSVREDHFSRIFIDTCPSDEEHLRSARTNPETGKPSCRFLLDDEILRQMREAMVGDGILTVSVTFIPRP